MFCTDRVNEFADIPALEQLTILSDPLYSGPEALTRPEYLSERTKNSDERKINRLVQILGNNQIFNQHGNLSNKVPGYLAEMIDLHQAVLRR